MVEEGRPLRLDVTDAAVRFAQRLNLGAYILPLFGST